MSTGKAALVKAQGAWIAPAVLLQVPPLWLLSVSMGWRGPLGLGSLVVAGLGSAALASRRGVLPPIALSCLVGYVAVLLAFAAATGALSTG